MGRLVAAVIALAVFVTGAMYWSQAHQDAETAPGCIYPCLKSTVAPGRAEASEGAKDKDPKAAADKDGCTCCQHTGS